MRPVFALSAVLFGLVLALNHAREWFGSTTRGAAPRTLEIVVGAKGPLLPAAERGAGPARVPPSIRLGPRTLVPRGPHGLQAAFLTPDFEVRAERSFDLAHAAGAAQTLLAEVEDAHEGELVVLGTHGDFRPPPAEAPTFERALATLGARTTPGRAARESWALIALRGERAWIPLAESRSVESGVALAFVLSSDLQRYAAFAGDRLIERAPKQSNVTLEDELPYASVRTDGVELALGRSVLGQPLQSILVPVAQQAEGPPAGRVVWEDVELGDGAWLFALVGLADRTESSNAATCEVRVDGERVGEKRELRPGSAWRRMLVDLRAFHGRRVRLELGVEAGASGVEVLWGRPTLLRGYERSPLER